MMFLLTLVVCVLSGLTHTSAQLGDNFLDVLLDKYGTNGVLSKEGFYKLSTNMGLDPSVVSDGSTCNTTSGTTCTPRCLGYEDIFQRYSIASSLNSTSLTKSLPAIIYSVQDVHCHHSTEEDEETKEEEKPSSAEAWGLSIASASVIVFISNIGAFFKPCMKTQGFQRIMYFCVSLAVGTLGATGLLVLIPESLGIAGDDSPIPQYKWKLITAVGGIYVFYLTERCINWRASYKKKKRKEINLSEGESLQNNVHSHAHGAEDGVATVAWTLLLGDALHNFSDGLAIGAAYTENVALGISVSLAVLTEELPHELGDIAILLHTGMTIKRALLLNFLAAVTIYIGMIIGIVVGENTDANTYIFAFAGGLFVYIALADMIPEMNNQAKSAEVRGEDSNLVVFSLQNVGLLVGFGIVILIATLGGNIAV
ncbi:metal cation symporter ZIP14-like [Ylistrum balloti]|uniref:metal cation symporter ZIP14-like n=1 Tax=Ylistrum balloti TaxID=509963 RepID=UPI0029058103|nr:metal cation symporter ZIP14-like [Ylistrum balloti]XP_060063007.1 metal cation symporter ZIP14-like [Ylistrum balloti]XP_060063008.1 metal cation symporter ZIP14-like [Ylistrum balloti]